MKRISVIFLAVLIILGLAGELRADEFQGKLIIVIYIAFDGADSIDLPCQEVSIRDAKISISGNLVSASFCDNRESIRGRIRTLDKKLGIFYVEWDGLSPEDLDILREAVMQEAPKWGFIRKK